MRPRFIWPLIEPHLREVERPSRYLNHERGIAHNDDADYRCALIYPDVYEIGQSNQGLPILYHILNSDPTVFCERGYLPWVDMAQIMRRENIPLFTLESYSAIADLDLIGFTLPHELAISNVIEALDLIGIPKLASERDDTHPLVIAGGPCTYNPEPFAAFFDLFVIGEGEFVEPEIVEVHREAMDEGASREETLRRLARISGIYVPSLYRPATAEEIAAQGGTAPYTVVPLCEDAARTVYKRVVRDFDAMPIHVSQIVPYAEVTHDRYNVEVLRGCCRGCRFCQAGMIYRPARERSADTVVSAVMRGLMCTGYEEVSLTSLSTTDHSQLEDILRRLNGRLEGTGVRVSIPSQRVDAFGVEMARLVAGSKKGGLTFAPEAGTQRLRDVINKNVTENDLLNAVDSAFRAGWRSLKLYFMCGLPTETDEDLKGIGELVSRALDTAREAVGKQERGNVRVTASCSVFVPKTHTPFQWCGQIDRNEIERRIQVIKRSLPRKGVDFRWHDPETSFVESVISRGGRDLSAVILRAWERGARFDAWHEHFSLENWTQAASDVGIDINEISSRDIRVGEPLPWAHISCGVSWDYLACELERSRAGVTTADCTFEGCTGCGLCPTLDCSPQIAGDRNA